MNAIKTFVILSILSWNCNASYDSEGNFQIAEFLRRRTLAIALEPKSLGTFWTGTAFFVSPEGHILTTAHVLEGRNKIYVSYKNKSATLVSKDLESDLAILKLDHLENEVEYVDVSRWKSPRYGDMVFSLGTPFGENDSFFISHISKPNVFGGDPTEPNRTYIQLDRIFFPGFSGAPLIDVDRRLLGVARYQLAVTESKHSGLGYAIHGETVSDFVNNIIKNK